MKQIYPGVYVLDTLQTPQYRQSKAGKYVDIYTNQRYENWQLSLKAAELKYKNEMDAYTARQKAAKEINDAIDNDIDLMRKEAISLEDKLRGISLDKKKKEADNETAEARYRSSELARNSRAKSRDEALKPGYVPFSLEPKNTTGVVNTAATVAATQGLAAGLAIINDPTLSSRKDGNSYTQEEKNFMTQKVVEETAARKGVSVAKLLKDSSDADRETIANAMGNPEDKQGGTASSGSSLSPSGTDYQSASYDISQEANNLLRNLEDKRGTAYARQVGKEILGIDYKKDIKSGDKDWVDGKLTKLTSTARIDAGNKPDSDIIGTAQNIYGSKFEALPAYMSRVDSTNNEYVKRFVDWKISKLPDTATLEDVNEARQEGIQAALYYAQYKKLPPAKAKPSKESTSAVSDSTVDSKPSTDSKPLAAYAVILGTEGNYQINYSGPEDGNPATYTVKKGDKPAVTYAEGTDEFKLLEERDAKIKESAEAIPDNDYTWKKNTEGGYKTRSKWQSNNLVTEYGPNTSVSVIIKQKEDALPKPLTMPVEDIVAPATPVSDNRFIDLGNGRKIKNPNADVPKQEDLPKEKEYLITPEERQRKIRIDLFKRMELPELGAALESLPSPKDVPLTDKQLEIKAAPVEPGMKKPDPLDATESLEGTKKIPTAKEINYSAAINEITAGNKLLAKPRLAERKFNNTPHGKYVDTLWRENNRSSSPKTWAQLRETVIVEYDKQPEKRNEALELLAYMRQKNLNKGKITLEDQKNSSQSE